MSFVPIIMGSPRDQSFADAIVAALTELGLESDLRIGSAHKVPAHVLALLEGWEADPRPKVYITIAGRSNALSGFVDAQVAAPVIACPPYSDKHGGADIYSSLRMPSGVAPALVAEPANAALLAAKILGLADPVVSKRVAALQSANRQRLLTADNALKTTR